MRKKIKELFFVLLMTGVLLTGCGTDKTIEESQTVYDSDAASNMSDSDIKTTIEMSLSLASNTSEYHNGSIEERAKIVMNALENAEKDGMVSDISREGNVIYFTYRNGDRQEVDISKDSL